MAKLDPQILVHLEWLGFVRPTGLVVSAPALVRAGAILDQRDAEGQRLLRSCLRTPPQVDAEPEISDFRTFATTVLGWRFSAKGYAGTAEAPIPAELEVPLSEAGETLRPDFAVRELEPQEGAPAWQLLVRVLDPGEDLDRETHGSGRLELSAHSRMERLLRQTGIPAGLLSNGRTLRLVSAPRGESSGWLDFRVADMVQTAGRPICTALRLLLSEQRLLALPRHQRLPALLADSRKFQNEVSEKLAEQVLHALYELLRGFQAAHDSSNKGELLRQVLAERPDQVYRALLTVILRLVFLLYAEERDMLPEDETFLRYYSIAGLHERLREDAALYPDTMDQRYGAWAQLVTLFRMVHDGADAPGMRLPPRHGVLFDPDRFPFLEGRNRGGSRQIHERIEPPLVPDGTVYRALEKLLVLDGERISYRALDVEQIGSVYETMMGFRLETATGRSVAIKAQKKHGAQTALDLDALLAEGGGVRAKTIQDRADRKLTDKVKKAVSDAGMLEDLHAALQPVIDGEATPDLVPHGAMVLQPSEERRRSGSHYTPRELTEPIVRTTLDPIFERLRSTDGKPPRPEAILDLKVCDPAMGSGAFLVEACRYLGDALVESWRVHGGRPEIPPDEDEVIFARRLIAQRCLYGVDRNPVAVDLAKMSLWLVTLAKDHALTFVDHALRHGDSLVGLSRRQLEAFQWAPTGAVVRGLDVREPIDKVFELRRKIREADENVPDWERRDLWNEAQFELAKVRLIGDLVIAAYFSAEKPRDREAKRVEFANAVLSGSAEHYRDWLEGCRYADPPLVPFHWEVEFPEVFEREHPGFDGFVGNPPFMGGVKISGALSLPYLSWLHQEFSGAGGQADLVAFFFRRAFQLLRVPGAAGLISTNSIGQGDTRESGLTRVLQEGGAIYSARRRVKWPGSAAVVVSVVHFSRGLSADRALLDGKPVDRINAFLLPGAADSTPTRLSAHGAKRSFLGSMVGGVGFTFEDGNEGATPPSEMERLLSLDPRNGQCIRPFLGGEEITSSPTHEHRRWIIDFDGMVEEEARKWPDLWDIVRRKVKPYRDTVNRDAHRLRWWQYGDRRVELYHTIRSMPRALAVSQVSQYLGFAFVPTNVVFSHAVDVFAFDSYAAFCALQARPHEIWARFFGSSMKDDLRYTPSDCFETFPFPVGWEDSPNLEACGKAYYEFRAPLMVQNNEGLTRTYNRFHDPSHDGTGIEGRDPAEVVRDIQRLRELHAAMDRAVLDAYDWNDIPTGCQFLLDYEIDEEEWGDKKKPYRYRWPDDVRDEVLARLLELNAKRAAEETRSGAAAEKKGRKKPTAGTKGRKDESEGLFA